jgi:hypothetical protein
MPFALLKIYHACRLKELVAGTLDGKDTTHVLILELHDVLHDCCLQTVAG